MEAMSCHVGGASTSPELLALIERAKSHVMSQAETYEQRRSFMRGMCPSNRDYAAWCAEVDKQYPPQPEAQRTDGGEPMPERTQARLAGSDDGLGSMQAIPRAPEQSGPSGSAAEKIARDVVTQWIEDCTGSVAFGFAESELLQKRIVDALSAAPVVEPGEAALDPYGEAEQWGMQFALRIFAGIAGVKDWEGGDGSETVEGDVSAEFYNIAKAAGWINADGDVVFGTAPPAPAVGAEEIARVLPSLAAGRAVTEQDQQYASELLADLANGGEPRLWVAAQWFAKARVENSRLRIGGDAGGKTGGAA